MSENYIKIVKKRLYMSLRGNLSQDWLKLLEITVDALNSTPTSRIGYLTPNSITSESDSTRVQTARKNLNIKSFSEENFKTQLQNQKDYNKTKAQFKVNDYVYLDFNQKLFDKSFDVSVSYFIILI